MNKDKKIISICIGLALLLCVANEPLSVSATDVPVSEQNKLLGASPKEWESATLREWLNSNQVQVSYTGVPPTYKDEPGFLSLQNFTQAEYDGIAVTRHGGAWQYSIGNRNNTYYWSDREVAHDNYLYNDKVFVLNYTDLVHYIERNGKLFELNKKYYSPKLQSTTNLVNKYEYLVNSGYYSSGYANVNEHYGSALGTYRYNVNKRVAPSLSLKPDFVLENGVKASDLVVGSYVEFGSYDGEPISWQVINKTSGGYPLLHSEYILMEKEYDSPGDLNPVTSSVLTFPNYDVNISVSHGSGRTWETQKMITATPVISITNESVLTTPTNEEQITIHISASDAQSGIRKLTLPDGSVVMGSTASFVIPANGEYTILAESNEGVVSSRHIITKAINTPAEVLITTNQSNQSKWTNKPVTINVEASNNGVYEKSIPGGMKKFGTHGTSSFPNWMSLGGKRVDVKGNISCAMTPVEQSQVDMNAVIRVRSNMNVYSIWNIGPSYPIIFETSFKNLCAVGTIDFSRIWSFPSNAYNSINFSVTIMDGNSNYNKPQYKYEISEITFDVLDRDDLAIEEIQLPGGNYVVGDRATYTAFESGEYVFRVKDNRGKITEKSIELAIDTGMPTATIDYNQALTNKNIVLDIQAEDALSGIREIRLPNGESRVNSQDGQPLSLAYTITENGTYPFRIIDFAGNEVVKTIKIDTIDKTPPMITIERTPEGFTSGPITLHVTAVDTGVGLESLVLSDGSISTTGKASLEVLNNGMYQFLAIDKIGNKSVEIVEISTIDTTIPEVFISVSPDSEWTQSDVEVTIGASD